MRFPNINFDFNELLFIDRVSRLLPWATPIYSAYLVIVYLLGIGTFLPVAIIEGIVVEGLGIVSVSTLLNMIDYNQTRGEGERRVPSWIAGFITLFYYVIIISVVYFLDITKPEQRLINGLLASLSLVSAILIGARSVMLQRKRDNEIQIIEMETQKEIQRLERLAANAGANKQALRLAQFSKASGIDLSEIAQAENAISAQIAPLAKTAQVENATSAKFAPLAEDNASGNGNQRHKETPSLTLDSLDGTPLKIYEILKEQPNLTNKAVADKLGISHQAVSPIRHNLAKSGLVELSPRSRK